MAETKEYQCENCGGTFWEPISREQEAIEERTALFASSDDNVRICHNCWVKLMTRAEKMGIIGPEWRRFL